MGGWGAAMVNGVVQAGSIAVGFLSSIAGMRRKN